MPACPLAILGVLACAQVHAAQDPDANRASGSGSVAPSSVQRAIDDLGEPLRASTAADVLVRAGPAAVARVAAVVALPQRYVEPRPRVLGALYVLGRLGRSALPALPVLESAAQDRDWGIADQGLWALAEVGQYADAEARAQFADGLGTARLPARVCRSRLLLGDAPADEALRADLCADDAARVIAACLQLRPAQFAVAASRDELRNCLRIQIDTALLPLAAPWDPSPLRAAASALAAAWLQASGGERERDPHLRLLVGRGLLSHYRPELRRAGLLRSDGLAGAALAERAELLPLLADPDAELRQQAVWTFRTFGRDGLLALPQLRRLQRIDGDIGVRMACTSVADDLLRAAGGTDDASGALLAAIDARLRGADETPLPLPTDPAAVDLLVQILCGAEWSEATVVRRLLPVVPPGTAAPRAVCDAVLRFCINVDDGLRALAGAWLVRHGQPLADTDLERTVARMAEMTGRYDPVPVEVLAWLRAGPDAPVARLAAAAGHDNARVVVRATAELLRHVAAQPVTQPAAREAVPATVLDAARAALQPLPDAKAQLLRWVAAGVDLAPETEAAATLLLLAGGAAPVDRSPLRLLAPRGVDADDWIDAQVRAGAFADLAARLESDVVALLEVPAGIAPR